MTLSSTSIPWICSADDAPQDKGSYVLRIVLSKSTPAPPRFKGAHLAPGTYYYFGSAFGPGGLRARLKRHMRKDKSKKWHVDWLTLAASDPVAALAFPEANEHLLAQKALTLSGASAPIKGFGSSDCKICPAHLVAYEGALSASDFCS